MVEEKDEKWEVWELLGLLSHLCTYTGKTIREREVGGRRLQLSKEI